MIHTGAIDIHAHYFPQKFLDLFAREGPAMGAVFDTSGDRGPIVQVGTMRVGPLARKFTDLQERLADMDRQEIGVQALSLTEPMVYWAGDELGHRLAAAFNDGLAEAHQAYPDRFVGLAMLPMQAPDLALSELERVAKIPGIVGVYMATRILEDELSEPRFFPIYERIEALGWPIFLHPINVIGIERLKARFYLNNLLGNPFDSAIAAAHLIFGEVLDRFPSLTFCLPHAGGAFPYLVGRVNHGWEVRPECQHLKEPPVNYLRRFYYDTISHSPEALDYLLKLVGIDRVVVGSDYCFDMGTSQPRAPIITHPTLTEAEEKAVLIDNAFKLLNL